MLLYGLIVDSSSGRSVSKKCETVVVSSNCGSVPVMKGD